MLCFFLCLVKKDRYVRKVCKHIVWLETQKKVIGKEMNCLAYVKRDAKLMLCQINTTKVKR